MSESRRGAGWEEWDAVVVGWDAGLLPSSDLSTVWVLGLETKLPPSREAGKVADLMASDTAGTA